MNKCLLASALGLLLASASADAAVTINVVNQDPAGQGLNDPTAASPVGGNPGTTVGQQRQIVYRFAADLLGSVLNSDVPVNVGASFQNLACTETGGTLGSAGATWVAAAPPSGSAPGMIFHGALGNAVNGARLNTTAATDVTSRFNANLGGHNPDGSPCMAGSGWYYGLDGNTPAGKINFLDVVIHEIAHGMGFSGFVGYSTGVLGERTGISAYRGYSDVYTNNAISNLTGRGFDDPATTNAERALAIRTRGAPAWRGAATTAQVPLWLDPALVLDISGGAAPLVTQFFGVASFGPTATAANFNAPLVVVNDGVGDTADACEPLAPGSLSGKIAYINRGTCSFEPKAVNAQNAGAVGVIIGNVASSADPGTAPGMAEDPTVTATIPTISVNLAAATQILAGGELQARLGTVAGQYAGADNAGRALLYAPATVASGSSFSHFETVLKPDALMEPANTPSTNGAYIVDLTLGVFKDIGWGLDTTSARLNGCDTGIVRFTDPGVFIGANLIARERVCRVSATGNRVRYLTCVNGVADDLQQLGLISAADKVKVRTCATRAGVL